MTDSGNKFHDRRLVCENSKFQVFFDHIEDENGAVVPDFLVLSPKRRAENLITGVAILPVVDGKYALLKVYRHAISGYSWEIPRGFVEQNEESIESAVRELGEELGFYCKKEDLVPLCYLTPDAGIISGRTRIFAASGCRQERSFEAKETGHRELRLFDSSEIERMIGESAIQDPCTIVAYYRYISL